MRAILRNTMILCSLVMMSMGFFACSNNDDLTALAEPEVKAVAEATAVDTVVNMPFAVTAKDIYAAILAADAIGKTML